VALSAPKEKVGPHEQPVGKKKEREGAKRLPARRSTTEGDGASGCRQMIKLSAPAGDHDGMGW
jgi:hypothetical protein